MFKRNPDIIQLQIAACFGKGPDFVIYISTLYIFILSLHTSSSLRTSFNSFQNTELASQKTFECITNRLIRLCAHENTSPDAHPITTTPFTAIKLNDRLRNTFLFSLLLVLYGKHPHQQKNTTKTTAKTSRIKRIHQEPGGGPECLLPYGPGTKFYSIHLRLHNYSSKKNVFQQFPIAFTTKGATRKLVMMFRQASETHISIYFVYACVYYICVRVVRLRAKNTFERDSSRNR